MEGWRQWRLGGENLLTQAGLLMEGVITTVRRLFVFSSLNKRVLDN
jgi:hypothetical protein